MYTKQSKKMIAFDILEILQQYTDENHRLSQREIEKYLADKYDMVVDRKSVKRNIMDLIDMGIDIQYTEMIRTVKDKATGADEEQSILTGFYIQRDFTDCEIRLLIDELLDSKYIPGKQRMQLISKLEGLSNVYFRKNSGAVKRLIEEESGSNQLFFTLDILDDAIVNKNKVKFKYRTFKAGAEKGFIEDYEEHVVTPLETEVIEDRYLLICHEAGKKSKYFRLDYIYDIKIIDARADISATNMYVGSKSHKVCVKFASDEILLDLFIDTFGQRSLTIDRGCNDIIVKVNAEPEKALSFATKYPAEVIILEPASLRDEAVRRLQNGLSRYQAYAS